jgi:DNA-binding helix-turn-helix protein
MAIGQRIKFFRNRKSFTQKQFGKALGFQDKTSDVRIAQYESEARIPRQELLKEMAQLLDVSTHAITVPDIDTDEGLMHTFFALEDMYDLSITEVDGKPCLSPTFSSISSLSLEQALSAWLQHKKELNAGAITKEQYDNWRYQYPSLEIFPHEPQQKGLPEEKNSDKDQSNYIEDNTTSITENFYLIDFENVHEAGLSCSRELNSHDHIHIFSTENAPKISLEPLVVFNSSDLESHIIPAGKQSLDMHLTAYLGYLIGMHQAENCKYIVVSKDTDYDNIISFLKKTTDSEIIRQAKIEMPPKKAKASASNQAKASSTEQAETDASDKPKTDSTKAANINTQLKTEIEQILHSKGYDKSVVNQVVSIVLKHYGKERFANLVHNDLRSNYKDYLDIYKAIKPVLQKYPVGTSKQNPSVQRNKEVQDILSKASFQNSIITDVASIVCQHYKDEKAKQTIHTLLVQKYGSAKGLDIYNRIKKCI